MPPPQPYGQLAAPDPTYRRAPLAPRGFGGLLDSFFGPSLLSGFGGIAQMVEEGRADTNTLLQDAEAENEELRAQVLTIL